MNVRGLNKSPKLESKMTHILRHLDTDIKVIIDTHADQNTLGMLRKEYRIELAKYEIIGNFTKKRGIMVLTRKSCGYKCVCLCVCVCVCVCVHKQKVT